MRQVLLVISFFLLAGSAIYCQHTDSIFTLKAHRPYKQLDPQTHILKDFTLCGEEVTTDSIRFFTVLTGCERNMGLLLGRYAFYNDTFHIVPFDFLKEPPFLKIYKKVSTNLKQTIKFVSADYQDLNGRDSSWIVKCFKRQRNKYYDFSSDGLVKVGRGRYDGIELMQLTKIFGGPVVMFLDKRFDYYVVVNIPSVPLKRFITGANGLKGAIYIYDDHLYSVDSEFDDGFKIWQRQGKTL